MEPYTGTPAELVKLLNDNHGEDILLASEISYLDTVLESGAGIIDADYRNGEFIFTIDAPGPRFEVYVYDNTSQDLKEAFKEEGISIFVTDI